MDECSLCGGEGSNWEEDVDEEGRFTTWAVACWYCGGSGRAPRVQEETCGCRWDADRQICLDPCPDHLDAGLGSGYGRDWNK